MKPPTELFDAPLVPIPLAEVERLAAAHFGLVGTARPLSGERDQNFHLQVEDGPGYVFKLHPQTESPATVDFQIQALRHVARVDPGLAVPRVLTTLEGEATLTVDLGVGPQLARVLSWLPGVRMSELRPLSAPRLRGLGHATARLDRALRGFFHPCARYPLLWDIQAASQLWPFLVTIDDPEQHHLTARALERFEAEILPVLPALRAQPIHNDCNHGNVLYAPQSDDVAGILDFGDMVHAPLVQELAVTASYHVASEGDPLGPIRVLVAAYHEILPLEREELDLLPDLILTRAVLSSAIGSWRASWDPRDADDIRAAMPAVKTRLQRLLALDRQTARADLRATCGLGG